MKRQGQPWAPMSLLEHTSVFFSRAPSCTYLSFNKGDILYKTVPRNIRHNYPCNYMYCEKAEMHTPNL